MSPRPIPCTGLRDAILERAAGAPARPGLDQHLATCSACSALLAREVRVVAALRGLERRVAPRELDGCTVAATQAGFRQERAAEAVRGLAREPVPAQLEQRLSARRGPANRAPAVLDRLVAEELAESAQHNVRRWTGRLERLPAPVDLRRRIEERQIRRRRRIVPLVASALAIVLLVGALVFVEVQRHRMGARGMTHGAAAGPQLVVERVDSLDQLDPVARQLLAGVTGGMPDARRLAQEEL